MANFDFFTWLKSRKNTVEKYLAMLLCVVLIMTGFPVEGFAETGTETGNLKNGGFESFKESFKTNPGKTYLQLSPKDSDVWKTTAQEGKMEVLKENLSTYISGHTVKPREGDIAAELNADEESSLYQIVDTEPSSLYEWGISHAARTDSDTMALIIGPNQEVAPSKNMGEGYDKGDFNTLKTGYKYGKDQMMQMVAWLKSMGQISNYENKGIANDGKPVIMYSKKFAALGGFQDNADNQPFSMKSSSVYTEKWYVWVITDKKEFDSSGTLIWGDYGSNDENNANSELDLDSYYLYSVPSGQTKTLFAFTSVENKPNAGSKYPDPTYGNFLDGVNFKLYRALSGGSTDHGSAVLGSSDGNTSGTGGTIGYEITSGNDVLTYVEDGKALEIQAKIAAADKTEVSFAGVFMTVQNPNGTGSVRKFISAASGWTITEDENGNRIFKTQTDSITSATDLYFVFVRSPMIVYDSNGGKAYQCNQQEYPENEKNTYSFQPFVNGTQVDYIEPYTAHAAEGQNDAWKFEGWSLFDNESFRTDLVPGKHTVAYNQQSSGGEGNKFIVLGGDDSFYQKVENESVKWETHATPLYDKSAPGLMFIAQWRWRQVFVPKTDDGAGLNESDNGGTVKVTSISNSSDENYNNSYSDKGAVAYYAELNEIVTAKATAKEGYYFDGWYDKDGNQVTQSDTITFTESKEAINTYSAHFIKLYEQRFIRQIKNNSGGWDNLQDGDASTVALLDRTNISEVIGAPVSSTATNNVNYGLEGWYDSDGNKVPDSMLLNDGKTLKYDVTGNATYYARFEPAKTVNFMIQFVNNDGSLKTAEGADKNYGKLIPYSANGVIGDIVSSKAYPSAGYELVGWYDSPELSANKVDCIDTTDSKIIKPEVTNEQGKTYYARFKARTDVKYTVTHRFKNWDGATDNSYKVVKTITYYNGITGEEVTPDLIDLSVDPKMEGYRYEKGQIAQTIRGDGKTSFTIDYIKTPTELVYHVNAPSGVTESDIRGSVVSYGGNVGHSVTVKSIGNREEYVDFAVNGYIFNGWNTKPDGTGTPYSPGDAYYLLENITDADNNSVNPNVLYAQWVPKSFVKYTVQHIKLDKDGNVINPPANIYEFYGTTGQLVTATVKSYPGYSFVEGYSENIKQGNVLGDESLVLKLHYEPDATKLTYKANGGAGDDKTVDGHVDEVKTVNDVNTFTRSGYTFIGWNTKADGSGTSYAAGSSYTLTAGEDILYAQWKANSNTPYKVVHYKVSPDGMTAILVDTDNKIGPTGASVTASPTTYAGYTYKSDFDSNGMKSTYVGTIAGDGSLVLKLYYIPNTVKLTYYPNGGQGSDYVVNGRYSEQITVLGNMFTRPGYTFIGWNTEENPSSGSAGSYDPNNLYTFGAVDGALYAQWTANTNTQYKVEHYKVNADGTGATLVTSDVENLTGTTDTTVNATAKSYAGYTYAATFDQNSMKTVSSGTVVGDGSLVLKLYYTPNTNTKYTVKYFKVNAEETSATEAYSEEKTGTTGSTVIASPRIYAGYTYKASYDHNHMKTVSSGTVAGDGSLVLKLYYTPNTSTKYTVKHHKVNAAGTASSVADSEEKAGTTDCIVNASSKTYVGYTYKDSYDHNGMKTISSGKVVGDGSLVLNLYYVPNTDTRYTVKHYKVNADGTGATLVTSDIENLRGTTDTTVNATAKSYAGYTYAASFDQNSMKTVSSGTVAGDGSLVLKLYYTPNATTLTYKANGGEGSDIVDAGVVDEKLIVRSGIVFTKSGYTFKGWNTKADGSGTSYAAGSSYTLTAGDDVLYAQWTANETTLTYKSNGGTGSDVIDNGHVDEVKTVKAGNIFTRTGYTFKGWNTKANGSGTSYAAGSSYTLTAGEDVLYAQWTANTTTPYKIEHYKVNADRTGATLVTSDVENLTGTTDTTVNATAKSYAGYTYAATFDQNSMKTVSSGTVAGDGSLVLKLYYTPNATTLTYKANGGEGSDIVDAGVVDEKLIVRSGIVFTRTGYTFAGWNTKADGSGTLYEADNVYTLTVDEDVLYAQWEEVLEEETLPPTSPTSPQNPNQPQTGDTVNLLSWLIVMVISALAMISILFYFRKKK